MGPQSYLEMVRSAYNVVAGGSGKRARLPGELDAWLTHIAQLLSKREQLGRTISTTFPTPFAVAYCKWDEEASRFWTSASVPGFRTSPQAAFFHLNQIWKALLDFLPFVLMLAVNRLDRDAVSQQAPKELKAATGLFSRLYKSASRAPSPAIQISLLWRLFRILQKTHPSSGRRFIFHELFQNKAFQAVIPEDTIFEFDTLRRTKELVETNRQSLTQALYALSEACCLNILSTLAIILERYQLYFVTSIDHNNLLANAIGVSGLRPRTVLLRLDPNIQESPFTNELYLVDSLKLGLGLSPEDWLKVTPFLLYYFSDSGSVGTTPESGLDTRRDLFVFRACDEQKRVLYFLKFASGDSGPLGLNNEDLFRDYLEFRRSFLSRRVLTEKRLSLADVKAATWTISVAHVGGIADLSLYDMDGQSRAGPVPGEAPTLQGAAFCEELFVWPDGTAGLRNFPGSEKRACIIVGPSGIGKSALACACFLEYRRQQQLAVFLNARLLPDSNLREWLRIELAGRLGASLDVRELLRNLSGEGYSLILLVDAVNEFQAATGGPKELLRQILDLALDESFLPLKIIATCRIESWDVFRKDWYGENRPLPNCFLGNCADNTFILQGFASEEIRSELYSRYQRAFNLRPENHQMLGSEVKRMIQNPSMLALLAGIYSNRGPAEAVPHARVIPASINYFALFEQLTNRKTGDARRLLAANDPLTEELPATAKGLLLALARAIYNQQLAGGGDAIQSATRIGDAVTLRNIRSDPSLAALLEPFSRWSPIPPLTLLVEVGLLERTSIVVPDHWGRPMNIPAVKFFHDQYAQYWLGAVCRESLGALALPIGEELASVGKRFDEILERSSRYATLGGALTHWLYAHISEVHGPDRGVAVFALMGKVSDRAKRFIAQTCVDFLAQRVFEPDRFFREPFGELPELTKLAFADAIAQRLTDLPVDALSRFLHVVDLDQDDAVVRRLADGVAQLAVNSLDHGKAVCSYLSKALVGLRGRRRVILAASRLGWQRIAREVSFVVKFLVICAILGFDDEVLLETLRSYLVSEQRLLTDSIVAGEGRFDAIGRTLKRQFFAALERNGINQWDQAIGSLDDNNSFFVESDGLVQRDALFDFYEYAVGINNEEPISLEAGSDFRTLILKLLSYRAESVLGYVVTALLTPLLSREPEFLDQLIADLMHPPAPGRLFHASLLLLNLRYGGSEMRTRCLALMRSLVVPAMLEERSCWGKELLHCMTIASFDPNRHWSDAAELARLIIARLDKAARRDEVARLGVHFAGTCFLPNPEVGRRLTRLLLESGLLENENWRECVLDALAGLRIRRGEWFETLTEEFAISEAVRSEVERRAHGSLRAATHEILYQAAWNRFLAYGLSRKGPLRYFLVRDLLAGLVQSNSVPEFAREFRRFVCDATAYFATGQGGRPTWDIDVAEALNAAESRRQIGGGLRWIGATA